MIQQISSEKSSVRCMCVNSTISVVILMILLWNRLKMATFWAIAVAFPMVFFSMAMSAGLGHAMFRLQERRRLVEAEDNM